DCAVKERVRNLAQASIGSKEERLVLDDRAADGAAKLIPMKGRRGSGVPPVIRIEDRVTNKLKQRPVNVVCAGLGQRVDNAVLESAVVSRIVVGLDAEFLNSIRIRQNVSGVADTGHIDAAIKVVVHRACAGIDSTIDQRALLRIAEHYAVVVPLNSGN